MRTHRRAALLGATLATAALTLTMSLPAQAATPGWRVIFTHHYGTSANASGYLTVVAPGNRNAWAFGGTDLSGATPGSPVAEHWNGKAWAASTLPGAASTPIEAASAPAASDIWAVTHFGGSILHWNGAKWAVAKKLSGTGQLTGVTAFSASNVWVFGGGGFTGGLGTWHYNGKTWTQVTGSANGIDHAGALSPSSIWAIGGTASPQSAIVHYNGSTWSQVKATALAGLQFHDVLAVTAKNIWALASPATSSFSGWLAHFNGSGWSKSMLPYAVTPGRVAQDGHGGLWLTGQDSAGKTWLVHRSGTGVWSRSLPASPAAVLGLALIPGTSSLLGAGLVLTQTGANAVTLAYGAIP
jgi:hypothetical protein